MLALMIVALAEDRQEVLQCAKQKTLKEPILMKRFINSYGGERTKKIFNMWLGTAKK